MKYTISIDQVKSIEWGLNQNLAALFSIISNLENWADQIILNGKVFYYCSRNKVIDEIPLFYSKPDTVYRAIIKLSEFGLIEHNKLLNKDIIRLTNKGKEWNTYNLSENSEINPNELGNKSDFNSEINPTNNNTNIDTSTNDTSLLSWKNNFEVYKNELREVYNKLVNDTEFIKQQEELNPNVDILLTLKKSCLNFWATEAGWKHKKKKRSKDINWKSTLVNSISQSMNRVYKSNRNNIIDQPYLSVFKSNPKYERWD